MAWNYPSDTVSGSDGRSLVSGQAIGPYPFSVSLWFKPHSTASYGTLLGINNSPGSSYIWAVNWATSYVTFGGFTIYATGTISEGVWNHILCVRTSAGYNSIYVNGVLQESVVHGQFGSAYEYIILGTAYLSSGNATSTANAYIAEVAVWDADKSSDVSQLAAGYKATDFPDDLVFYDSLHSSLTGSFGDSISHGAQVEIIDDHPLIRYPINIYKGDTIVKTVYLNEFSTADDATDYNTKDDFRLVINELDKQTVRSSSEVAGLRGNGKYTWTYAAGSGAFNYRSSVRKPRNK